MVLNLIRFADFIKKHLSESNITIFSLNYLKIFWVAVYTFLPSILTNEICLFCSIYLNYRYSDTAYFLSFQALHRNVIDGQGQDKRMGGVCRINYPTDFNTHNIAQEKS